MGNGDGGRLDCWSGGRGPSRHTGFRGVKALFAEVGDQAEQGYPSAQHAEEDVEVGDGQGRHRDSDTSKSRRRLPTWLREDDLHQRSLFLHPPPPRNPSDSRDLIQRHRTIPTEQLSLGDVNTGHGSERAIAPPPHRRRNPFVSARRLMSGHHHSVTQFKKKKNATPDREPALSPPHAQSMRWLVSIPNHTIAKRRAAPPPRSDPPRVSLP